MKFSFTDATSDERKFCQQNFAKPIDKYTWQCYHEDTKYTCHWQSATRVLDRRERI